MDRIRRGLVEPRADDGFTLVEILAALVVIGIIASSFLTLSLSAVRSARAAEGRSQANQVAQNALEAVVTRPWASIGFYATDPNFTSTNPNNGESTVVLTKTPADPSRPQPVSQPTVKGVQYTITTYITWKDDASDGLGASDGDGNTNDVKHVVVSVAWQQLGLTKSITLDDIRSATATEVPPSSAVAALSVTVTGPATQTLATTGYLNSAMTITATTNRVATGATLSYKNRNGSQTVAMTSTNGGTVWTVVLPTTTGPFDTTPTGFGVTATTTSYGTASGSVTIPLVIGNGAGLSVSAAPSQTLSALNMLSQAIVVTATATTSIASASMSYPTHTGSAARTLASNGTGFTYTVPVDSTTYDAGQETFTISVTFSDGTTATGLVTINLFVSSLPPDVTSLTVNDPYSSTGSQSFCVSKQSSLYTATSIDVVVANVAATDTVRLTAPNITTTEFPMSYLKTNADGSMTFRYTVPSGTTFPSATSIVLKAYALKTISGTQYRDDYVSSPAPTIQSVQQKSSCT